MRRDVLRIGSFLFFFLRWIKEKTLLCLTLYWRFPSLLIYDLAAFSYSLVYNPYVRLNRKASESILRRGEVYGETPWRALSRICQDFGISSKDSVLDLGSGLGKGCFWFAHVVGCKRVCGVDREKKFLSFAKKVGRLISFGVFCSGRLNYVLGDFTELSFTDYSCVYFYGTSFSPRVIRKLIKSLASLPKNASVISVSYPLTEFLEGEALFFVEKTSKVSFPWGSAEVYKNIRK
ncbi:class I SAM-dependent methyltransferase [Chlamydiifrater phoenicopteri]|uniref:class I SAM-dependent methyltransferase n=1 Tax=Chlamydiifrater phoenicopteri TaxID=2681469 RepID=UPI001FEBC2C4|nr:class I SAM-dependent methyltransferase [Chlamydiifrater phoenicopteri]